MTSSVVHDPARCLSAGQLCGEEQRIRPAPVRTRTVERQFQRLGLIGTIAINELLLVRVNNLEDMSSAPKTSHRRLGAHMGLETEEFLGKY